MKKIIIALVVAAVAVFLVVRLLSDSTATVTTTGRHYTITVTADTAITVTITPKAANPNDATPTTPTTPTTNPAAPGVVIAVTLIAAMPSMGHALPELTLAPTAPGAFRTVERPLPMKPGSGSSPSASPALRAKKKSPCTCRFADPDVRPLDCAVPRAG